VRYPLGEPFFSVCGWLCGQTQIQKSKPAEKVLKYKKVQPFQKKKLDFMELLPRFELGTSSLPTSPAKFFTYFSVIYSRFCSFLFAFRHSLKTAFPCIPLLSVAGYVVRNPCGT
jgi:Na+(H+)/acetate symporter ActP